jgi:predicted DNA-binding protein YlxM (UPF0122 family)
MDKNIRIACLLDYYGDFLTDKQRELMDMHYNEDLSLGEIAGRTGITRQGAHDALKRAACVLERCEARLRLMERTMAVKAGLESMGELVGGKPALDEADTARLKDMVNRMAEIWEGGNGL